jgi:hypothetical protein
MNGPNVDLGALGAILARGYLRLLTGGSAKSPHLSTCLADTVSRILDSPLDVGPGQRDEWCGGEPHRSTGCRTP